MKTTATILLTGLFVLSLCGAAVAMDERHHNKYRDRNATFDNTSIDFDDDGTLILKHKGRKRDRIEITADYDLYINGRRIKTNDDADDLLRAYYKQTEELIVCAEKIGIKAGKIGIAGGALGVQAVEGVLRAFLTDYEFDDLEDDLEEEAEKLEEAAEDIEEEAEEIEEMADDLEELAEDLSDEVPELRKMRWFYD